MIAVDTPVVPYTEPVDVPPAPPADAYGTPYTPYNNGGGYTTPTTGGSNPIPQSPDLPTSWSPIDSVPDDTTGGGWSPPDTFDPGTPIDDTTQTATGSPIGVPIGWKPPINIGVGGTTAGSGIATPKTFSAPQTPTTQTFALAEAPALTTGGPTDTGTGNAYLGASNGTGAPASSLNAAMAMLSSLLAGKAATPQQSVGTSVPVAYSAQSSGPSGAVIATAVVALAGLGFYGYKKGWFANA